MNDSAIPLARCGRLLAIDPVVGWQLSEEHAGAWVRLTLCRTFSAFSRPAWGDLFGGDSDAVRDSK